MTGTPLLPESLDEEALVSMLLGFKSFPYEESPAQWGLIKNRQVAGGGGIGGQVGVEVVGG